MPAAVEELEDDQLSDAGLRLLLRIRHRSDERLLDGYIADRQLRGLASEAGLSAQRLGGLVRELKGLGYIETAAGGVQDRHFARWCKTRDRRLADRDRWLKAKGQAKEGQE